MSEIVDLGDEIIRLNRDKARIEYSRNGGRSWYPKDGSSVIRHFTDIFLWEDEVLACAGVQLYASNTDARRWHLRYGGIIPGTFEYLYSSGNTLMAKSSKGTFYSKNKGESWSRC